jgi:hypothetical protein
MESERGDWGDGQASGSVGVTWIIAASKQPPPPLGFFIAIAVVTTVGLLMFGFFGLSDTKWKIKRGKLKAWEGEFAASSMVDVPPSTRDSAFVAQVALAKVGGRDVQVLEGNHLVGWKGRGFSNVPRWAEYQLVVTYFPLVDGSTRFTCSCRPRNPSVLFTSGLSKELSRRLADEIMQLASG